LAELLEIRQGESLPSIRRRHRQRKYPPIGTAVDSNQLNQNNNKSTNRNYVRE
jgi:hypothetical protein